MTEVGDGQTLLPDLPCTSREGALLPGGASSCAQVMWPSSTLPARWACPAATPWSLGIADGSAFFEGLAGEVAVHAAGLVDAAPRALAMVRGCDGASEGVAGDVAAATAFKCLHIQAAALLVMEEREEWGCCCGRAAGGAGGRGRGGRAGGRGHGGRAGGGGEAAMLARRPAGTAGETEPAEREE
jgi:hypothetical protein